MHLLLKWLLHFYKFLCSLATRLGERELRELQWLYCFWHSNQLCKLAKVTLHSGVSHVRRQRNADARSLYSPVSFWPPHTLPFTFYGPHAEPNSESNGTSELFHARLPLQIPWLRNESTREQDYLWNTGPLQWNNSVFWKEPSKNKGSIFCPSAKNNRWQGCSKIISWLIQFALNAMRYHNTSFCNLHKRCTVAHRQEGEPSPHPSWKPSFPPAALTASSATGILDTELQCIILLKVFDRNWATVRPSQHKERRETPPLQLPSCYTKTYYML